MTPLEAMCRAMRDSEPGMEKKDWRYWLPSARAALLALAESALSERHFKAGREATEWDVLVRNDVQTLFHAICRSIAEEGKENG